MSFQALISGSECAAPSNPLSQVLKHTEGDHSLQQDRNVGPSSSRLHHLPSGSHAGPAEHDLAHARQFFNGGTPGMAPNLMYRPQDIQNAMMAPNGASQEAWSSARLDAAQPSSEAFVNSAWATEFSSKTGMPSPVELGVQDMGRSSEMPPMSNFSPMMYRSMMSPTMYSGMNGYPGMYQNFTDSGKGKGKAREIDFEDAFAKASASFVEPGTQSGLREIDESEELATSLNTVKLDQGQGDPLANQSMAEAFGDTLSQEDMAKWEAEFNQLMQSQREEDLDYGASMQQAWEDGLRGAADTRTDQLQFDENGLPIVGPYEFEQNNKYLDPSSSTEHPLQDAKALLLQNGSLSEAALLLEAAIQKGDLGEGGYEAWILLGETRSMDEREEAGMRALTEGVRIAENAGAGGPGMLSLAISFTNESLDRASHTMLLRWLRARYSQHPVPPETIQAMATNASWDTHERVTQVFIDLARTQHSQGIIDPDVQMALGVLFYTYNEYDRAKDCFETALQSRPDDYLLWNRLGSSLSNGSKPEEALGAYREALRLRPTYTRAIYNVGVACLNIGAHKEAAEHFLSAIAMQEMTEGKTSDQLWFTLRRALLAMDRVDLAEKAQPAQMPHLDMFRREGFEF